MMLAVAGSMRRKISRELVVPEIARPHAGRDHQIIERDFANAHARGRRLDRTGSNLDSGDLRQEHAEVFLLHLELTDRRGDLGRREHRRRHLVEQWLKDVVIAPVNQDDIDISMPQRACRGDAGEAAADDDDALALRAGSLDNCSCLVRPSLR
jgi:hypothetical protein